MAEKRWRALVQRASTSILMDGFEATRLIRTEEPLGRRTPFVAMMAHAMIGSRERCRMDDYLSKPLHKTALLAIIEQISATLDSS